jgi:DNA-3-methyladenine glycosylase II
MNNSVQKFFEANDPILHEIFLSLSPEQQNIDVEAKPIDQYFHNLCESIISQQLSVKASDTIWGRFKAILPQAELSPRNVLNAPDDDMRSVGLSRAKVVYVKALAAAIEGGELDLAQLPQESNEEVIRKLTWVKGIGKWTAEMFIMFTLGRPDVFSLGDLGLRNAVERWYGSGEQRLSLDQIEALSQRWSPYRTFAARILWRSLELPASYFPTGAKR